MVVTRGVLGMGDLKDGELGVGLVLDVYSDDNGSEYYEIQWPDEIGWWEPRQLRLVSISKL